MAEQLESGARRPSCSRWGVGDGGGREQRGRRVLRGALAGLKGKPVERMEGGLGLRLAVTGNGEVVLRLLVPYVERPARVADPPQRSSLWSFAFAFSPSCIVASFDMHACLERRPSWLENRLGTRRFLLWARRVAGAESRKFGSARARPSHSRPFG